jgi:hypothetical protein
MCSGWGIQLGEEIFGSSFDRVALALCVMGTQANFIFFSETIVKHIGDGKPGSRLPCPLLPSQATTVLLDATDGGS